MGNFLYIIAIILMVGWAVGYFGFQAGSSIHVLLLVAAIAVIIRFFQGKSTV